MSKASPKSKSLLMSEEILTKIEIIATDIVVNDFSPKLVYHTLKHIRRVAKATQTIGEAEKLSPEELALVQMGAWLNFIGLKNLDDYKKVNDPYDFFDQCFECTLKMVEIIFKENDFPQDLLLKIRQLLQRSVPFFEGEMDLVDHVFRDAITIEMSSKKGPKRMKLLYEEMLLTGAVNTGPLGWYELALNYLKGHQYYTSYGQEQLMPQLQENYLNLQKEYKNAQKQKDYALQKELDITDEELKDLKKKLKASKGRDDRGIQTMFRTTSKNHYTLNEMVDRKASIMISVNSIILSVIIGGLVQTTDIPLGSAMPIFIMIIASFLSIIFAVLSIIPDKTHGKFTAEEIHNKKGNLLFFGNFHSMDLKEYEWGILQMLSDQDYLYSTLIRDIYYLGQTLDKKYRAIRISLGIFMIGTGLAFGSFFLYRFVM